MEPYPTASAGSVFTPRPTIYCGIEMRSRMEAGFAQWCDSNNIDWEYEPQTFASPQGQYLPDFRIDGVFVLLADRTIGPLRMYVEVKPMVFVSDETAERMKIIWESEKRGLLVIQTETTPLMVLEDESSPQFGIQWVRTPEGVRLASLAGPYEGEWWRG